MSDSKHFYNMPKGMCHTMLKEEIFGLRQSVFFKNREKILLAAMAYYGNIESVGHLNYFYNFRYTSVSRRGGKNVVRRLCDTVQSKMLGSKPRPMFLTRKGDWATRERAKKLNRWVEGKFQKLDADQTLKRVVMDALIFGQSNVKFVEKNNDVHIERVFVGDLFVGQLDGRNGTPNTLYQIDVVSKRKLCSDYPSKRTAIMSSGHCVPGYYENQGHDDFVMVFEAWDLPIGKEKGRHVLCTDTATLLDEEWNDDFFPFAFLRWKHPVFGFWGTGIPEQLFGHQNKINKLEKQIDEGHDLIAIPRVYFQGDSNLTQKLRPGVGYQYNYQGAKPEFYTPTAFNPETYNYLETQKKESFEEVGVSPFAAYGERPAGLNSGRAQLVAVDQQDAMLIDFQRDYESLVVAMSKRFVELARRIVKNYPQYSSVYIGKNYIEEIKWKDVDIKNSEYVLSVFPVSMLPSTPQGKLSALQEMLNAGLIDRDTWLRLSEFPDLDAELALQTAPREIVEDLIYKILVEGEAVTVEPFFNLELCIMFGGLAYMRAKADDAPLERLALLSDFIEQAQLEMKKAMQEQQPQGQPQGPVDEQMLAQAQAQAAGGMPQ